MGSEKGKGWVAIQYGDLGQIGCWDEMILISADGLS